MIKPRPLVFLAAPYTHDDLRIVQARINAVCAVAAQIEREGKFHAVSPLYNQLLMDRGENLPVTSAFWKSYSLSLLEVCSKLIVLELPGYEDSVGVGLEVLHASKKKLPIEFWNCTRKSLSREMRRILRDRGILRPSESP